MPDETNDDPVLDATEEEYSAEDVSAAAASAMDAAESATEDADSSAAEESEAADDGAESEGAELTDKQRKFLALEELGVEPEELVSYARKGYSAEHDGPKKAAPAPADESATDDDDYLPVTKKELRQTLKQFAQEAAGSITAATADATIEQLLDTSDFADDETSRAMVRAKSWGLIKAGTKPRAAFKQAQKLHMDWIARQVATTNKKKVTAKRTAGTSSGGLASPPLERLDIVHKDDDFQTGEAHNQAVDFMRNAGKLGK